MLLGIGLILNVIGIYYLLTSKLRQKGNTSILVALSFINVLYLLNDIAGTTIQIVNRKNYVEERDLRDIKFPLLAGHAIFLAYFGILMILTLNRLTVALVPLKHQIYCSLKVIRRLIATCVFIGVVWLIALCFMDFSFIIKLYEQSYILLTLGSIILATSILTYSVIFRKLVKSRRKLTSTNSSNNSKALKVFLLINFTYISFVIIPNILFLFFST